MLARISATVGEIIPFNEDYPVVYGVHDYNRKIISCVDSDEQISNTELYIRDSVEYNGKMEPVSFLTPSAFAKCGKMRYIRIPATINEIESWVFDRCLELRWVYLPGNDIDINQYAFEASGVKLILYTSNNLQIADKYLINFEAQKYVNTLKVDTIGRVDDMWYYLLDGQKYIYSVKEAAHIDIPEGYQLHTGVFDGMRNLQSVSLPSCITSIPENTFTSCDQLREVIAPEVTEIGNYAFAGCSKLQDLTMPKLKTVGKYAFKDCTSIDSFDFSGIQEIKEGGFYGCTQLHNLDAPILNTIDNYSFKNCTSLASIEVSNAAEIKDYAFSNCTSLTTLDIPNIVEIKDYAFYNCSNLGDIILPESLTKLGIGAFQKSSITTVDLSNTTLTAIADNTFSQCENLVEIFFPDCVKSIGAKAFYRCAKLERLVNPNGVETIGEYAFGDCVCMRDIYLLGIKSLSSWCFDYCRYLETIHLGPDTQELCSRCFSHCINLMSITCDAVVPPVASMESFRTVATWLCELHVPEGCEDAYRSAPGWDWFKYINVASPGPGSIDAVAPDAEDAVSYDLYGRRVKGDASGRFRIQGGKIVKNTVNQ